MVSTAEILNAKVLIVDDQEANVVLLVRMLEGAGYTRVAATMDPFDVCKLHREHRYDLILLDLQMPGMDGFEVLAGLKEIEVDGYVAVLAVTAQPAHKLRALKGGAKDFVSKPFDLAEVLMRIHNLLEVRLLHDAARDYGRTLEPLALQDPLTGLANRRRLAENLRTALAHGLRNRTATAVLYLDLDGFGKVNETWGHGVGDALLKMVAERLVRAVRAEDTVARLGGDEFLLALWQVSSLVHAGIVAAKVIDTVAKPYPIGKDTLVVTASVGVSIYPDHGEDANSLIESADFALYEAKRAGKNAYRIAKSTGPPISARDPWACGV